MIKMSNSSFTGVSNEDSLNRIAASSADISTIRAGIINCDSVQISVPKTAIIIPTSANHTLSAAQMSLLARGDVLYQDFGTTCTLRFNAVDTAAEALKLLQLFNITDVNTARLIRFNRVNTIAAATTVTIGGIGGFVYVQYLLQSTGAAIEKLLSNTSSSREAYVLVYRGSDVGTDKTIVFDIIGQA